MQEDLQDALHLEHKRVKYDASLVRMSAEFFLLPENIRQVAYGVCTRKLTDGTTAVMPKIQRNFIRNQLYKRYILLFPGKKLPRCACFNLLNTITSVDSRVLAGLDNLSEELGRENFASLRALLKELPVVTQAPFVLAAAPTIAQTERVELFLKAEFSTHVVMSSTVATHCAHFALSDSKNVNFRSPCNHAHSASCDTCNLAFNLVDNGVIRRAVVHSSPFSLPLKRDSSRFARHQFQPFRLVQRSKHVHGGFRVESERLPLERQPHPRQP